MINVSVVGASGYSGIYLIHALSLRQDVTLSKITSRSFSNRKISDVFPVFTKFKTKQNSISDLLFTSYDVDSIASSSDVVFFCLPHGESSKLISHILKKNNKIKIIDIGADYRFDDLDMYEEFYGKRSLHDDELNSMFVYGLGDVFYDKIKNSQFVANPGCYPTGALLPLLPILDIVDSSMLIIIDALSGISGAGRIASLSNIFCEVENSVKAYNVWSHRHMPEIREKIISAFLRDNKNPNKDKPAILFTPHIIPIERGILTTIYLRLKNNISNKDILGLYTNFYKDSPFVSIMESVQNCNIKNVIYSNNCHIAFEKGDDGLIKIFSAIDNLGKGASLQALQNMNLMFGLESDFGISPYSPFP